MYTGDDWPSEALQDAKKTLPANYAHVLLAGERQDAEGIREVLQSLSYLQKYGRPFLALYGLTFKRPDHTKLFLVEEPFKHTSFTVPVQRLDLLQKMIDKCPTLIFEIVYTSGNEQVRIANFNVPEGGKLVDTVKEALEAKGWSVRMPVKKKTSNVWNSIYDYAQNKAKKMAPVTFDRWFNELSTVWKRQGKTS